MEPTLRPTRGRRIRWLLGELFRPPADSGIPRLRDYPTAPQRR